MKQHLVLVALLTFYGSACSAANPAPAEDAQILKSQHPKVQPARSSSLELLLGSPDSPQQTSDVNVSEDAWRLWKLDVASVIKQKLGKLLDKAKISCYANLEATVQFKVSKTGEISDDEITEASSNARFDATILESIRELKSSPVLKFPEGAIRDSVDLRYPVSNRFRLPRPL